MMVVVDNREPPVVEERITALLSDAIVMVAQLPAGDIRMDWLTIERKTPRDFMNSWHSHHLDIQIADLVGAHGPKRPLLAVHGEDGADLSKEEWHQLHEHLRTLNFMLPTYYFPTLDDLIMFGAQRVDAWRRGVGPFYHKRPVRVMAVGKRSQELVSVYTGLPGISDELAERLAEAYPSPADLTDAIRGQRTTGEKNPWWEPIRGIGKKKAAAIKEVWMLGRSAEKLEKARVLGHARRARLRGLPHTLTAAEWRTIIADHEGRCHYCWESVEFPHQEHVVALVNGGPYTAENIVPSCSHCNSKKGATLAWPPGVPERVCAAPLCAARDEEEEAPT